MERKNMRIFLILGLLVMLTFSFATTYDSWSNVKAASGSTCRHSWSSATCTSPRRCSKCGRTSGSSLGHSTAYEDQGDGRHKIYCSRCGARFGQGTHSYGSWKITKQPTCTSTRL